MLSDEEIRTLAGIERRLVGEDPRLARSFRTSPARSVRPGSRRRRWAYRSVLGVTLLLLTGSLLMHLGMISLLLAVVAAVTCVLMTWGEDVGPAVRGDRPERSP